MSDGDEVGTTPSTHSDGEGDAHGDTTPHTRTRTHTRTGTHAHTGAQHSDDTDAHHAPVPPVQGTVHTCTCGLDDVAANEAAHQPGCWAHTRYQQRLALNHGVDIDVILQGFPGSDDSGEDADSDLDFPERRGFITTTYASSGDSSGNTSAGYLERSIRRDIEDLGAAAIKGRSAYVALAVTLGKVLDREADDVGVTAMAKAADALRVIMDVLSRPRGEESSDVLERLLEKLGEPIQPSASQ